MIRSLRQPGPAHPDRIDCFRGDLRRCATSWQPGLTLNEALTAPLVEAGFQCGTVTFTDVALSAVSLRDAGAGGRRQSHVAYFRRRVRRRASRGSSRRTRRSAGRTGSRSSIAMRSGSKLDGRRRGGHILPRETVIAETGGGNGLGFRTIRIERAARRRNQFHAVPAVRRSAVDGSGVVARVKPNEDILTRLKPSPCPRYRRCHRPRQPGHLDRRRFADGGRGGRPRDRSPGARGPYPRRGQRRLDLLVVDMRGEVHEGWLQRGETRSASRSICVLERRATCSGHGISMHLRCGTLTGEFEAFQAAIATAAGG